MSGDIVWVWGVGVRGVLLASNGQTPGKLFNILQYTGQPPRQMIHWPKMSTVPRLRNSEINVFIATLRESWGGRGILQPEKLKPSAFTQEVWVIPEGQGNDQNQYPQSHFKGNLSPCVFCMGLLIQKKILLNPS